MLLELGGLPSTSLGWGDAPRRNLMFSIIFGTQACKLGLGQWGVARGGYRGGTGSGAPLTSVPSQSWDGTAAREQEVWVAIQPSHGEGDPALLEGPAGRDSPNPVTKTSGPIRLQARVPRTNR